MYDLIFKQHDKKGENNMTIDIFKSVLIASCLFDFFIFILLWRESDGGIIRRTNPDSLRRCFCFLVFRLSFTFDFVNLLLVRFHQAEITVVKHLNQGRNNGPWMRVEPLTLRSWPSQKRRSKPLGHAADKSYCFF